MCGLNFNETDVKIEKNSKPTSQIVFYKNSSSREVSRMTLKIIVLLLKDTNHELYIIN